MRGPEICTLLDQAVTVQDATFLVDQVDGTPPQVRYTERSSMVVLVGLWYRMDGSSSSGSEVEDIR